MELAAINSDQVAELERLILAVPQVDLQTKHELSGKVYSRTIYIPAGTVLTGATHKKDHINIVFGDITVSTDDGMKRLEGHHIIPTKAGIKRAGYAHADTIWTTLCHTELSDIAAIEDELVVESEKLQTRLPAFTLDKNERLEY